MAVFTKPADINKVWAATGDVLTPSDAKITGGWAIEIPPRQYFNYIDKKQDQGIAHINQFGIAVWDAVTEYQAGKSYTQGSDGLVYKCLATNTNQNPVTDTSNTYWRLAFLETTANVTTSGIAGNAAKLRVSTTGTSSVITVTADSICLKNAANQQVVVNTVSVTPSFATAGVNGLDVGAANSQTVSTFYHVWVIWNGTTTAGLISLSATSPTLPTGYTHKARVGAVKTDTTANKYPFSSLQVGRSFQFKVATGTNVSSLPVIATGVAGTVSPTPTYVAVPLVTFIPTTALVLRFYGANTSTTAGTLIAAPNNSYAGTGTGVPPPMVMSNAGSSPNSCYLEIVLESTSIYWASSVAPQSLILLGWEDSL